MGIRILLLVLNSVAFAGSSAGQLPIDKAPPPKLPSDTSVETLKANAKNGSRSAMLELGRRGGKDVSEFLSDLVATFEVSARRARERFKGKLTKEEIDAKENYYKRSILNANMALARLGDAEQKRNFVEGLSSEDTSLRADCINAIAYIGDANLVPDVARLLEDNSRPEKRKGLYGQRATIAETAAAALGKIHPEIEKKFPKESRADRKEKLKAWREWWTKKKSEKPKKE